LGPEKLIIAWRVYLKTWACYQELLLALTASKDDEFAACDSQALSTPIEPGVIRFAPLN
jgi:hypothetical protein